MQSDGPSDTQKPVSFGKASVDARVDERVGMVLCEVCGQPGSKIIRHIDPKDNKAKVSQFASPLIAVGDGKYYHKCCARGEPALWPMEAKKL